jgi:hypothetical protein
MDKPEKNRRQTVQTVPGALRTALDFTSFLDKGGNILQPSPYCNQKVLKRLALL